MDVALFVAKVVKRRTSIFMTHYEKFVAAIEARNMDLAIKHGVKVIKEAIEFFAQEAKIAERATEGKDYDLSYVTRNMLYRKHLLDKVGGVDDSPLSAQMWKVFKTVFRKPEERNAHVTRYIGELVLSLRRKAVDCSHTERAKAIAWERTAVLKAHSLKFDDPLLDAELCDHMEKCYSAETCNHRNFMRA